MMDDFESAILSQRTKQLEDRFSELKVTLQEQEDYVKVLEDRLRSVVASRSKQKLRRSWGSV